MYESNVASSGDEENEKDCLICLQPILFRTEAQQEEWACGHHSDFHNECIEEWFLSSHICPVCRDIVISEDEEEDGEGGRTVRQRRRRGFTQENYEQQRKSYNPVMLFTMSFLMTCVYSTYGKPFMALICLLAWGLVALQACAETCSYLWLSLLAFVSLHIWMCESLNRVCTSPQTKKPMSCDNFLVIIYLHLFVCMCGMVHTVNVSLRQNAMRYGAVEED